MNVEKHIQYWAGGAEEDLAVSLLLFRKGHFRHALFLAQLSVEKILKAHVTKVTLAIPPFTHDLVRLVEMSKLQIDVEQIDFLRELQEYCMEGRYPRAQKPIGEREAGSIMGQAEEILKWLKNRL